MTRPTIIDVAKKCGLSKSTVSRAFQPDSSIDAATRGAILDAARKLGYSPNRSARSLRTASSQMIGIIVQDNLNPFYSDIVRKVEANFMEHNYDLIVTETHQDLKLERRALDRMRERQVDGIIIFPMAYDRISDLLDFYETRKIHCVVAGPPPEEIPFDCVGIDLAPATETAMDYLIGLGHRDLAFVCGAPVWVGLGGRLDIFRSKINQYNLPFQDNRIYRCGFHLKDGYEAGKYLLSMHPRPTAIFALNDLLAIGVMRAAKDMGLRIPEDVSVVGVDNIDLAAYVQPSLTTVAQPIDPFAKALSDLLLAGLLSKEKRKPERIELSASFLIRESTGICPVPSGLGKAKDMKTASHNNKSRSPV